MRQQEFASFGLAVAIGVVYFLGARLSLGMLAHPGGAVAVFWPAAGVASGTLIALGRNAQWPVAVGIAAATLLAHLMTDGVSWLAVAFALCNIGEALFIARFVERAVGTEFSLDKLRHVLWLLAAAILGATIFGFLNAAAIKLLHGSIISLAGDWWDWSSSNGIGIVTTAPLIIGAASLVRAPPPRREIIEGTAALLAVAAVLGTIIFLLPPDWWDRIAPVELFLPLLLWVSARCRPAFAAVAVFLISLALVGAFIFGLGYFGDVAPGREQRAIATDTAILGVAVFSYVLAALFAEQRRAEENQKTLTNELQHRTNNLLTVVQMIVNRTLAGNDPRREKEMLEARLQALARANKQLTELDFGGLMLGEIIRAELEPYLARCEIEGTDVVLDRQYAQNFSLVLHELATNAIKYGALSTLEGQVHINWDIMGNGLNRQLTFHWREQGGPPVVAPTRRGFGTKLLSATFANTRSRFDRNGFCCEIEVPLREAAPRTFEPESDG